MTVCVCGVLRLRVDKCDGEDQNIPGVAVEAAPDFDAVSFAAGDHAGIGDGPGPRIFRDQGFSVITDAPEDRHDSRGRRKGRRFVLRGSGAGQKQGDHDHVGDQPFHREPPFETGLGMRIVIEVSARSSSKSRCRGCG